VNLWIEQQGLCWICCEPMERFGDPERARAVSEDHLRPRSKGGSDKKSNKLLAHRKCNNARGSAVPTIPVADLRAAAILRLRGSPHWVDEYQDTHAGSYRVAHTLADRPLNGDVRSAEQIVRAFLGRPITSYSTRVPSKQVRTLRRRRDVVAPQPREAVIPKQRGTGKPGDE
jgi:hypothetical protein